MAVLRGLGEEAWGWQGLGVVVWWCDVVCCDMAWKNVLELDAHSENLDGLRELSLCWSDIVLSLIRKFHMLIGKWQILNLRCMILC